MSTIRERIILAVIAKLGDVRTAKGFNTNCGLTVYRAQVKIDPDNLPASVVWPQPETGVPGYGKMEIIMPLQIEGYVLYGATNPSVIAELILGDFVDALTGIVWTLPFTSGGTYQIQVGDTITGASSSATAHVQAVSVSSGKWADGDVAGNLILRRLTGTFEAENLDVGANSNVATIIGSITGESPETGVTGGLADAIEYASGGVEEYPDSGDSTVAVAALFNVKYRTNLGDPYNQ